MKIDGIDTLETIWIYHVNAATEPTWRSSICGETGQEEIFIDHPTPEAALAAALEWARGRGVRDYAAEMAALEKEIERLRWDKDEAERNMRLQKDDLAMGGGSR